MNIYCRLKHRPSADKMFYSNDHKTTCHVLCLYSWEHTPEMLNCVSWNGKPTRFGHCHTIGARKSGNLPDPAGSIDANGVGWRCECSCWSRCAGNVHQMNSCPPGSAALSACWKSCHRKLREKRVHKHYFSWKQQEDVFPIVTIKGVSIFMSDLCSTLWAGDLYRFTVHKEENTPNNSIMLVILPQASITQFIFQLIFTVKQMLFSFSTPTSDFHPVKQFCNGWINEIMLGDFVANIYFV